MNLSFSGCGFLGVYHVGVVAAFRDQAPEVLKGKISGCSAGALVAACALCDCCVGEMCSDALEIAVRARSNLLGPFYPTFSIVDIIRNGLRRILPPNAHEICSGRLSISLTHWRDKKNVLITQFRNRNELIDALICSSFVPLWSGIFPPKFRDEYYWDGGLTNNNPTIDDDTIFVSPFAGDSDICPRAESGSFYSIDFSGTDVSFTQENLARAKQALFPPEVSVLKQICLNGYNDALQFLQSRNKLKSSNGIDQYSISSILGTKYTEPAIEEEKELANGGIGESVGETYEYIQNESDNEQFESDESAYHSDNSLNDEQITVEFSSFCKKVTRRKDLPSSIHAAFSAAAAEDAHPIRQYLLRTRSGQMASWMLFPLKVTYDITCSTTKKMVNLCFPSTESDENAWSNRILKIFYSYAGRSNENKSMFHAHDCKCSERRNSVKSERSYTNDSHTRRKTRSMYQRSSEARTPSATSISSTSEFTSDIDDDDQSIRNSDQEIQSDCSSSNLTQQESYAKQLQRIACMSDQLYSTLKQN